MNEFGVCPVCEQHLTLLQDGTLRPHDRTLPTRPGDNAFTNPGQPCPGSNKPPKEGTSWQLL